MKTDLIEAKDNIRGCEVVKFSQSLIMFYEVKMSEYGKWERKYIELENMLEVAPFLQDHGYIDSYKAIGNGVTMYKGCTSTGLPIEIEFDDIHLGYEDVKQFAALRELTIVKEQYSFPQWVLSKITNHRIPMPRRVYMFGV